jgi:hypothetical protein
MQSIRELEKRVSKLTPEELTQFRAWFEDFDSKIWDDQFLADAKSGALETIAKEAMAEYGKGRCTEL